MLQAITLGIRRGTKLLFENTSFQIHPEQKVGLTGANGTGKSSLFSLILKQLHADAGDCIYPDNWVVAHVAQELADSSQQAIEFVLDGDAELREIQQAINIAEENDDGVRIATLHTQLDNIDGYTANSRASQLLAGLGFSNSDQSRAINEFSGGWQMRLNLAKALMCRSDLLLLDEPTNHLDLDTIIWLESWLKAYHGTLLLISHDRDFLNNICTHIAHLEHQNIQLYTGNYSAFERIRAERLANQQSEYVKQQRNIKHIESYIERFRAKATKAKQAQSRLKALERMQTIAPAHVDSPFHFSLFEPEKIPNSLLRMEAINAGYGDRQILKNIDFQLLPGDRIGLLGPNGAGKSTFIKVLANQLTNNLSIQQGEYQLAKETKIGYFAQHQLEQLHNEHTPVEHLQQLDKQARESDIRNYLGRFGFSNDMALSKIQNFSGGEKSRLVLAMLIYQKPNLLLLDEPTNHLDLEMREALAEALQDFSGAMVIVSHDRHLLNSTCDQLLLVNQQSVSEFPLGLDEYPRWLSEHNNAQINQTKPDNNEQNISNKERKQIEAEKRKQTLPLRNKIKKLEDEMSKISSKLTIINEQLSDSDIYTESNKQKLQQLLLDKAELDKQHEASELHWLDNVEQLEKIS